MEFALSWFHTHLFVDPATMRPFPELVDALVVESRPYDRVLVSSEAFYELYMYHPDQFGTVIDALERHFDLRLLMVVRDPGEQVWSGLKHAWREGIICDTARSLAHAPLAAELTARFLECWRERTVTLDYNPTNMLERFLDAIAAFRGWPDLRDAAPPVADAERQNADKARQASYEIMMALCDALAAEASPPPRAPVSITTAVFDNALLDRLGWTDVFSPEPCFGPETLGTQDVGGRLARQAALRARVFLAVLARRPQWSGDPAAIEAMTASLCARWAGSEVLDDRLVESLALTLVRS